MAVSQVKTCDVRGYKDDKKAARFGDNRKTERGIS